MILTKRLSSELCRGGSDLPEFYKRKTGAVVSCTIDKAMYIAIHPYFTTRSASSIRVPKMFECRGNRTPHRTRVLNSLGNRVRHGNRQLRRCSRRHWHGIQQRIYCRSFTCALRALRQIASPEQLASRACEIELDRVKAPSADRTNTLRLLAV